MLPSQLKLLVQLRYRLLWAHARTGSGKTLLFFALYFAGISVAFFLLLGGMEAVRLGAQAGRPEGLARGILSAIFANAIVITTMLEVGPSSAFSDTVLRRYPMTAWQRFFARHLAGICEPVWPLAIAVSLGLVIGFSLLEICPPWISLPTALLFVAVAYLFATVFIAIFGKLLQTASGPLVILLLIAGSAAGFPLLLRTVQGSGWSALRAAAQLSPPGNAALIMTGATTAVRLQNLGMLLLWGMAAGLLLRVLERPSLARQPRFAGNVDFQSWYDRLAGCFRGQYAPLVGKSLRYHLRSNRVRYNLVVTAPMFLIFTRTGDASASQTLAFFLGYLFIAGFICTLVMAVNHFGYDAAGVRRYPLLPLRFRVVLRAYSATSMLLGFTGVLAVLAFGLPAIQLRPDYRSITFLLFDMLAGLFFFHALGLWTSVLTPRAVDFNSVMGNRMSLPANLLVFSALGTIFAARALLHDPLALIYRYWWAMPLVALGCFGFYWLSLVAMGRSMEGRREALVQTVAGAANN